MRAVALVLGGLLGLLLLGAATLWLALPWLVAPRHPAAPVPAPLPLARVLGHAVPAAAGAFTLDLSAAQVDGLLRTWTHAAGTEVALAPGTASLRLLGRIPSAFPLRRLRGDPYALRLVLAPHLIRPGVIAFTLDRLRIGRLVLTAVLPARWLLPLLARTVPTPHPWWGVAGDTLTVNLAASPPLPMGPVSLRPLPVGLSATTDALALTLRADARIRLSGSLLNSALTHALLAHGVTALPVLHLQPGQATLGLPTGHGVRMVGLVPDVPQPGLLQVAVTGAGGPRLAALLRRAVGADPRWLGAQPHALNIDFAQISPFTLAPGIHCRVVPVQVSVGAQVVIAQVQLQPVAG